MATGSRSAPVIMLIAAAAVAGCATSHPATARDARQLVTPAAGGSMRGAFSETAGHGTSAAAGGGSGALSDSVAMGAPAPAGPGKAAGGGGATGPDSNIRVGLRAGSVDDNARFADYLTYRQAFASEHLRVEDFDVSERHVFTVTTPAGEPVLGADIVVLDGSGKKVREIRTCSDGRALWFPRADDVGDEQQFTAVVSKGEVTKTISIDRSQREHSVVLDAEPSPARSRLDLEFLVDATGSMGDEIAQLKTSLADIAARIDSLPAHPDVRFALTIYRDRGDEFLTRTWNFTSDVAAFQKEIEGVTADGGGDVPEDVQQGLHDALVKPSWRDPGTVKLVLLVGDAPPHLNYSDDPHYVADMQSAARDGIKIESLAASGLDDQGEYIWRQLAETTLGQFIFLTYGADDTTTHHVSGYTANNLDDLVVRLVDGELRPATTSSSDQQSSPSPSASPTGGQ